MTQTQSEMSAFKDRVQALSGVELDLCYHCQKCAAGCPVSRAMDFKPNQLVRLIQLELEQDALENAAIWLCTGCKTCYTRCPNGIDISKLADALKQLAQAGKAGAREKRMQKFHATFLQNLKRYGRIHEGSLIALLKLKTLDFFSDLKVGWLLFCLGKVPMLPTKIKKIKELREIIERCEEKPE